jgi:hypothetical protein
VATYQYNQYVPADKVNPDGTFGTTDSPATGLECNVISLSTYEVFPRTAGISSGIKAGWGAIAGEVHDCNDAKIVNAIVATSAKGGKTVYMNTSSDNPQPDMTRTGTNVNGIYAFLNVPSGPLDIAAAVLVDGQKKALSKVNLELQPDSVALFTWDFNYK